MVAVGDAVVVGAIVVVVSVALVVVVIKCRCGGRSSVGDCHRRLSKHKNVLCLMQLVSYGQ